MEFADLLFTDCGQGTVYFFPNLLKMYTPCTSHATSRIQSHVLATVGFETATFTIKAHSAARQFTNASHQMTGFSPSYASQLSFEWGLPVPAIFYSRRACAVKRGENCYFMKAETGNVDIILGAW